MPTPSYHHGMKLQLFHRRSTTKSRDSSIQNRKCLALSTHQSFAVPPLLLHTHFSNHVPWWYLPFSKHFNFLSTNHSNHLHMLTLSLAEFPDRGRKQNMHVLLLLYFLWSTVSPGNSDSSCHLKTREIFLQIWKVPPEIILVRSRNTYNPWSPDHGLVDTPNACCLTLPGVEDQKKSTLLFLTKYIFVHNPFTTSKSHTFSWKSSCSRKDDDKMSGHKQLQQL